MGTHRCGRVVRFSRGLFEFLVRTLALLVAIHWGSETLVVQLGAGAHGNNIFNAHGHTTALASCILEQADCTALELLKLNGYLSFHGISAAARDWGLIKHMPPAAVLHPDSVHDIAELIRVVASSSSNLTVAAKGPGHSVNGQAQVRRRCSRSPLLSRFRS
jgi:hypothetical protein